MFDDFIRNKANEHQAPVPPDAWDNIIKQKKKRRFGLFWWSGIALLLCGLSVTGYLINKNKNGNSTITTVENNTVPADKKVAGTATLPPTVPGKNDAVKSITEENTAANNELPVANTDQSATNSSELTVANADGNSEDAVNRITKKTLTGNKPEALATNSRKNKKVKARAIFRSNPAETGETDTEPGNNKPVTTITEIPAKQELEDNNSIAVNIEKNKTTIKIEKITATANEEKKTTQTTTNNKKENTTLTKQTYKQHWFIDAGVTPLLPVQQYDANVSFNRTLLSNNTLSIFSANLVKTSIDPAVAFSIAVRRSFGKKITLGLGLQYLLLKENIALSGKETNTTYSVVQRLLNRASGPELVNDTVATVTEGTRTITAINSYHLYSIPVFMQYNLLQKRSWNLSGVAGMYINISSSYQNEINRDAAALLTVAPASSNTNHIGYDLFAGLRFGKTVGKRVEFFAMPAMRWSLNKYNIKNSLLRKTIDQAGLSVGISYKLN